MCLHLEAVTAGEIKNLLILMPPGHSKSSLVSVIWPIWDWILDPTQKWLCTANDKDIALRDARRVLEVIQSPWFYARWPHVRIRQRGSGGVAAGNYRTTARGYRVSLGIGQRVVGIHANKKLFGG